MKFMSSLGLNCHKNFNWKHHSVSSSWNPFKNISIQQKTWAALFYKDTSRQIKKDNTINRNYLSNNIYIDNCELFKYIYNPVLSIFFFCIEKFKRLIISLYMWKIII